MPRAAKELTAVEIARLKTPGRHYVGGVSGLTLQVAPGGARNWVLRVWVGGKRREHGLGGYPSVTLAQARESARRARNQIDQGLDPIEERTRAKSALLAQQQAAKSFAWCAAQCIKDKSPEWSNAKHAAQWTSTLETYAVPKLGKLLVADVGKAQVLAVLKPIWQSKTTTAKNVRGRIEQVLDWAVANGYREEGLNPARWKGHLDQALAKPSKFQKVEHHAALAVDAVPEFMTRLRQQEGMGARALELAILTASRSQEVRLARWGEFKLEAAEWSRPAAHMKVKKEHRVPLSKAALELLRSLPRVQGTDLVFPSAKKTPLSDMTLTQVLRRMKVPAVPHGFRSSFRDWAAENTSYPRELAEMALAHALGNAVEAAYLRSDLFEKRRALMADWAAFCENRKT